mgnify:CR=1 FL=1
MNIVEETPQDASPQALPNYRRRKWLTLAAVLAVVGLSGVVDLFFEEDRSYEIAATLLVNVIVAGGISLWCHFDAAERGYVTGRLLRVMIILLAVIAFPVYAFRTRGLSGFGLIGGGALFFVAIFVVYTIARYVTIRMMGFPDPFFGPES